MTHKPEPFRPDTHKHNLDEGVGDDYEDLPIPDDDGDDILVVNTDDNTPPNTSEGETEMTCSTKSCGLGLLGRLLYLLLGALLVLATLSVTAPNATRQAINGCVGVCCDTCGVPNPLVCNDADCDATAVPLDGGCTVDGCECEDCDCVDCDGTCCDEDGQCPRCPDGVVSPDDVAPDFPPGSFMPIMIRPSTADEVSTKYFNQVVCMEQLDALTQSGLNLSDVAIVFGDDTCEDCINLVPVINAVGSSETLPLVFIHGCCEGVAERFGFNKSDLPALYAKGRAVHNAENLTLEQFMAIVKGDASVPGMSDTDQSIDVKCCAEVPETLGEGLLGADGDLGASTRYDLVK